MRLFVAMTLVFAIGLTVTMAGCANEPTTEKRQEPSLKLSASRDTILTGESVTLFANTANLLGRQYDIKWTTSMGQLTPQEGGRQAMFTSSSPGTSVVTAEVNVDGRILRDSKNITVNPVR